MECNRGLQLAQQVGSPARIERAEYIKMLQLLPCLGQGPIEDFLHVAGNYPDPFFGHQMPQVLHLGLEHLALRQLEVIPMRTVKAGLNRPIHLGAKYISSFQQKVLEIIFNTMNEFCYFLGACLIFLRPFCTALKIFMQWTLSVSFLFLQPTAQRARQRERESKRVREGMTGFLFESVDLHCHLISYSLTHCQQKGGQLASLKIIIQFFFFLTVHAAGKTVPSS